MWETIRFRARRHQERGCENLAGLPAADNFNKHDMLISSLHLSMVVRFFFDLFQLAEPMAKLVQRSQLHSMRAIFMREDSHHGAEVCKTTTRKN